MKSIVGLAVLLFASFAYSQQFQSTTATNARVRYEKELLAARERFNKRKSDAAERYARTLKSVLVSTTKAGNLDEANKLKAEVDRIEKSAQDAKKPDKSAGQELKQLVGKWQMRPARSSDTRSYTFQPDGSVKMTVSSSKNSYSGKVIKRGDDLFIDFGDRDFDRLTVVGNRIFLEHWRGPVRGFADDVQSGYRVD